MSDEEIGRAIEILLVEDNPGDIDLTKEALEESKVLSNLHLASDGTEAMAFLRKQGEHSGAVHPDLILLDLNLPKMGGCEVLAEIKNDPALQRIPVVVLTTSQAEQDVLKAYNLHANCYITKPVDLMQFSLAVRSVEDFWFSIVKLPPN